MVKEMVYFLFCVGCLFTHICYKEKRHLEDMDKTKTVRYAFAKNAIEVIIPFTSVTLLYAILTYSLSDMGSDQVTLETLRHYERQVQWVQDKLKYFKLDSFYSFLLLGAWFIVSLFVRHRLNNRGGERLDKAYAKYETYNKWITRVSVVVTLLGAFTFFGAQVDGLGRDLQACIKTVKDNYNAYTGKVEKAVEETIATEVHKRIVSSAPARYARAVSNPHVWERYLTAADRYRSRVGYKYESPKFESLESRTQRQEEVVTELISEVAKEAKVPRGIALDVDSQANSITNGKIKRVSESLDKYAADLASRAEPILNTPLGKKLIPSVLGVLITHKNIEALNSLADQSPILKAILPVVTKTLSKKVELQTNEAIQRLAAKAVTQPQIDLEREIANETTPIVKEVVVEWNVTPEQTLKFLETAVKLEEAEVSEASAEVNSRFEVRHEGLVKENRQLLSKVNKQWQEKMPTSSIELQEAFKQWQEEMWSTDPVGQHKILESTWKVVNTSSSIELIAAGLAALGGSTGFPDAFSGFVEIEKSENEKSIIRKPLTADPYGRSRRRSIIR